MCDSLTIFLYYRNYYGYKNKTRIRQENKIGYKLAISANWINLMTLNDMYILITYVWVVLLLLGNSTKLNRTFYLIFKTHLNSAKYNNSKMYHHTSTNT